MPNVPFETALTFTRASTGTYFGSDGLVKTAAVNEKRLTHDPVTREALGLLIEEQRTNLLLQSQDLSAFPWGVNGAATAEFVATGSPVGGYYSVSDATSFNDSLTADNIRQSNIPVGLTGDPIARYFCVRNNGGNLRVRTTNVVSEYIEVGDTAGEWVFIKSSSFLSGGTGVTVIVADSVNGSFDYAFGQMEPATTSSSYIPTTTAQVTRAADNCSRFLGSEFNGLQGRFIVNANAPVGEIILQAGTLSIVSDFEGLKEYDVSYTSDIAATNVVLMPENIGTIKNVKYIATPEA